MRSFTCFHPSFHTCHRKCTGAQVNRYGGFLQGQGSHNTTFYKLFDTSQHFVKPVNSTYASSILGELEIAHRTRSEDREHACLQESFSCWWQGPRTWLVTPCCQGCALAGSWIGIRSRTDPRHSCVVCWHPKLCLNCCVQCPLLDINTFSKCIAKDMHWR